VKPERHFPLVVGRQEMAFSQRLGKTRFVRVSSSKKADFEAHIPTVRRTLDQHNEDSRFAYGKGAATRLQRRWVKLIESNIY
jgi:hypothetical protein